MIEEPIMEPAPTEGTFWQQHRFLLLIGVAIGISLFLVGVALALYASSGAAQLDLSRPGYQSVRQQATQNDSFGGFSATGPLDKAVLEQFQALYDERAGKVISIDSFGSDVMSDENLSLTPPPAQ